MGCYGMLGVYSELMVLNGFLWDISWDLWDLMRFAWDLMVFNGI